MAAELGAYLSEACSSDSQVVKNAERNLLSLRTKPGFFPALVDYSLNSSGDCQSRVQAVLYLKNAIDTDWRNRARSSISPEEKGRIRAGLLAGLNEQSDLLALHLVVVISKIARIDCPHDWPLLIPTLAENLQSFDLHSVAHMRTLHAFYLIIKSMASKRLALDIRKFRELTRLVYSPIFNLLQVHMESIKQENDVSHGERSIVCARFCIKSLRYLTLYGFSDQAENQEFALFMNSIPLIVHKLLEFSCSIDGLGSNARDKLHSSACQVVKMMGIYVELRPLDLLQWLQPMLQVAFACAFDDAILQHAPDDKLTIRSMNFMRQCLLCMEYKPIKNNEEGLKECNAANRAADVLTSFFDLPRIRKLTDALLTYHLPLEESELCSWDENPEQFALQINDADKATDLKTSAECLLGTVMHVHWELCATLIQELGGQLMTANVDMHDTNAILRLDAVLCVLGLSASDYYDSVDFPAIFSGFILSEGIWVTNDSNFLSRVLQRRALWLCCKWIGVKFDMKLRPPFFQLIVQVLSTQNYDLLVQLTAVEALHQVDDFEFSREELSPHLNVLIPSILGLIGRCVEDDIKMTVVRSLSVVAERMGREMCGQVNAILHCLSQLWTTDHNLLKCQMLVLLTYLVKDLRSDCVELGVPLCVILSSCVNPQLDEHVYLIDDGLELWQAVLEHTPAPLPQPLLQLAQFLPELILSLQTENLKIILEIVQNYILFECNQFDEQFMERILSVLQGLVEELRQEAVISILKLVERFIATRGLMFSNVLVHFVKFCEKSIIDDSPCLYLSLRVHCLGLWSRVIIARPETRFEVTAQSEYMGDASKLLQRMLNLLILLDSDTVYQKLGLLCLCSCIATANQNELALFANQLYTISECLHNLCESKSGKSKDVLIGTVDDMSTLYGQCLDECLLPSEQDRRLNVIRSRDAVYTLAAPVAVTQSLIACKQYVGVEAFGLAWQSVDAEVQKSLQRYCDLTTVFA